MALDRKTSVGVGLAVMGLVAITYQQTCPKVADLRVGQPMHPEAVASERQARWISAGMVGLVTAITRDPTVFILGAGTVICYSWLHRFATARDPISQTTMFVPASPVNMHTAGGVVSGATASPTIP